MVGGVKSNLTIAQANLGVNSQDFELAFFVFFLTNAEI
jgi:hypothetical protein